MMMRVVAYIIVHPSIHPPSFSLFSSIQIWHQNGRSWYGCRDTGILSFSTVFKLWQMAIMLANGYYVGTVGSDKAPAPARRLTLAGTRAQSLPAPLLCSSDFSIVSSTDLLVWASFRYAQLHTRAGTWSRCPPS
jgi:hypothetical protein